MAGVLQPPVSARVTKWRSGQGHECFFVKFSQGGVEFDEAGPFDSQAEAVDAARRTADDTDIAEINGQFSRERWSNSRRDAE